MPAAPSGDDESRRIDALRRLNILDTPAEDRFDRITRLARRLFRVPMAAIGLVDSDRVWFKSRQGLMVRQVPRQASFCGEAILRDQALVVPDARQDPRFAGHPLVTNSPNVRFYAGHPIRLPDGGRVGTICIFDLHPRTLDPADLGALRDLAMLLENEIKASRLSQIQQQLTVESALLRQQALVDTLTQTWNRRGITELLRRELEEAERQHTRMGALMADVDMLKGINETFGQATGDETLRELAQRLRSAVRPYDSVGRYGGDEFLILLPRIDSSGAEAIAERIRASLGSNPVEVTLGRIKATLSIGGTAYPGTGKADGGAIVAASEAALADAKSGGGNRVRIAHPRSNP